MQPVDPIELWKSPPFEPEVRNGNLYARGAVDDKGQMLALVKALESLMRADGTLPVNIKILFEGEEEAGGASIEKYVREHPEELACDAVLVADTGMPAPGVPAIIYSLRGILYTEIVAKGAKRDLHSGVFGGIAPNPLHALALVLAGLKGADGKIKIPGLYRKVKRISEEEQALWARNPVDESELLKKEMGIDSLPGEQDYPPLVRMWGRPTLEVHGFVGGFTGEGAKTVIPAEGRVKVSLRLPPEIKPAEVLRSAQEARRGALPARRHDDGRGGPRWLRRARPAGQRLHARGRARAGAGVGQARRLHARGRLDPGRRALRQRATRAGHLHGHRSARRQHPRAQREVQCQPLSTT